MNLDLAIDPSWAIGLLLAQIRVAMFTVAAPQLGAAITSPGRMAFVIATGFAMTGPVTATTTADLIAFAVVNAAVGIVLGFVVGLLFHLFAVAGALADLSAATSIASVLDPTRGEQGAVFSRLFQVTGLTLFHVAGGMALLVSSLAWSVRAVPLDGQLDLDPGIGSIVLELVGTLMVAGFELAVPIVAALFLIELTLGLAARFAPTANVFLLGMPVKVGVAMLVSLTALAMFPQFVAGMIDSSRDAVVDVLNGMGVPVA